jgi:hypothetical protein
VLAESRADSGPIKPSLNAKRCEFPTRVAGAVDEGQRAAGVSAVSQPGNPKLWPLPILNYLMVSAKKHDHQVIGFCGLSHYPDVGKEWHSVKPILL